jgi:hypothetical protein
MVLTLGREDDAMKPFLMTLPFALLAVAFCWLVARVQEIDRRGG